MSTVSILLDFWHPSLRFRFLLLFVFRLSEPVSQVKVGRFRPPVQAARGRLGWTLDLKCGGSVWKFLVTSRFRLARFSNYSIRNVNIIHKWQADFNEGLPEEETFIIFQEMEDELSKWLAGVAVLMSLKSGNKMVERKIHLNRRITIRVAN